MRASQFGEYDPFSQSPIGKNANRNGTDGVPVSRTTAPLILRLSTCISCPSITYHNSPPPHSPISYHKVKTPPSLPFSNLASASNPLRRLSSTSTRTHPQLNPILALHIPIQPDSRSCIDRLTHSIIPSPFPSPTPPAHPCPYML